MSRIASGSGVFQNCLEDTRDNRFTRHSSKIFSGAERARHRSAGRLLCGRCHGARRRPRQIGADAIRAWKVETGAIYRITVEPLESRSEVGKTIVVAKVSGTFPGIPANLTYRFGLSADGQIRSLEVR